MAQRLNIHFKDFAEQFKALVETPRGSVANVSLTVSDILSDVAKRGDEAVCHYTNKFDGHVVEVGNLRIREDEVKAAIAQVDAADLEALKLAAGRIEAYHKRQMPTDDRYTDDAGVELGCRWTAIDAVGLYVPGGKASYPSSVLMNAVPAKVAGVSRLVMCVPTPNGELNPLVLAAADIAGVDEIYRIGGAQAIAAMAYGTDTIAAVDKIVGPGNAFVAEAKRQVFGKVGIDLIAGPSEILVVADGDNVARMTAIDLLSQAEHDETAQSILLTDDGEFADKVEKAIEEELKILPSAAIASKSWNDFGAIIVVGDLLDDAPALVDALAPEHLMIATDEPEALFERVKHAGAIFMGRSTPEAIGDYVAGSNHVLPTNRSARFSSGLTLFEFLKRTSVVRTDSAALAKIGPAAVRLADAEGLPAHATSVSKRLKK